MWLTSTVKIDHSQSIPGAEWPDGNEVPKTILTGFTCPSLPSSLAVLAHLFSMCVPYYLGAWNRPYLILQNVLCDRIYNTRHKSWNTCVIFPFPNVLFGYYSRLSAPKYAWLSIGKGVGHIWGRTRVSGVNVRTRNGSCFNDLWRVL